MKGKDRKPGFQQVDLNETMFGPKLRIELHTGQISIAPRVATFVDTRGGKGSVSAGGDALHIQFDDDPTGTIWEVRYRDIVAGVSTMRRRRKLHPDEIKYEPTQEE